MATQQDQRVKEAVLTRYGSIARGETQGCGCGCGSGGVFDAEAVAKGLGYAAADLADLPDGANLGLGCANPRVMAAFKPGETVLDLGAGGGVDCFVAAKAVGPRGRVIGVDMTPDMLARARANAAAAGLPNLEFRLGEIEHLPVADGTVDVIISNCVINLAVDKERVYREAYRVLKPGGRLAIADIVALQALPEAVRQDLSLVSACIGGAQCLGELEAMLLAVGFEAVRVEPFEGSRRAIADMLPGRGLEEYVASAAITARRPLGKDR